MTIFLDLVAGALLRFLSSSGHFRTYLQQLFILKKGFSVSAGHKVCWDYFEAKLASFSIKCVTICGHMCGTDRQSKIPCPLKNKMLIFQ